MARDTITKGNIRTAVREYTANSHMGTVIAQIFCCKRDLFIQSLQNLVNSSDSEILNFENNLELAKLLINAEGLNPAAQKSHQYLVSLYRPTHYEKFIQYKAQLNTKDHAANVFMYITENNTAALERLDAAIAEARAKAEQRRLDEKQRKEMFERLRQTSTTSLPPET
ncbi:MAG: hypothetical protein K0Q57_1188, partial [Gammaproteobacteria bacterium]|nr:hypothetical protein [Gammaproteobacteria bacterium]